MIKVNTLLKKEILYETGKDRATEILYKIKSNIEATKDENFSDLPELLELNKKLIIRIK